MEKNLSNEFENLKNNPEYTEEIKNKGKASVSARVVSKKSLPNIPVLMQTEY